MDDSRDYADNPGRYWHEQLDHAEAFFKEWLGRGDKVVKRYRDERDALEGMRSKFNILWSNVQVLKPSLYGRPAKCEVSRRYMDADPVGRLASMILERAIDYEVHQFPDFNNAMESAVEDRLLPGRGIAWIRYEPVITQESLKAPAGVEITNSEEMTVERIASAHAPIDYVFWKDFLHSPARTWDEVWWVARRVYMTTEEGEKRFGPVFRNVPLSAERNDEERKDKGRAASAFSKKAIVFEIWNQRTAKVCWIAKDYPQQLDEKDDPLQLEGFFPCPKPLYATLTTGSLIPVPDYCEYEDQARELDSLTGRITMLVKAIKAVGVYNAEYKELARLLTEGQDNKLFPVTNWAALAEKNGLEGAVDLLDISTQVQALTILYKAREDVKQTIYEICGISDILRGATKAEETLGAQQLKANFGSLRLRRSQVDVARYATDIFKLKAQVICKFYPREWIIQMSGIQNTPDGQNPQLVNGALDLLANAAIRDFHIAVESDSLAQIDETEEKQAANEAITAIGGFIKEGMPMVAQAPETLPMVSEMLLFLVRRYRAGRGLESAIERTMNALQQKAAMAQQNPPPTKEETEAKARQQSDMMRAQFDAQAAQMRSQAESQVQQAKLQTEAQLEMMKAQQEKELARLEGMLKLAQVEKEDATKRWIAELDNQTKLQIAGLSSQASLGAAKQAADAEKFKVAPELKPTAIRVHMAPPKTRRKLIRSPEGKLLGMIHVHDEPPPEPQAPEVDDDGVHVHVVPPAATNKRVIYDQAGRMSEIVDA